MNCQVDGCNESVLQRGYCNKHLLRWRRHGDPLSGGRFRVINMQGRKDHMVEYRAWDHMIYRCTSEKCPEYPRYGGRGIKVCDRWLNSFDDFLADVGSRPSSRHSIDRFPDNDGHYEPGNCRWATMKQQADNRRNSHRYPFNGQMVTPDVICAATGIKPNTFWMRVHKCGWSVQEAATIPVGQRRFA